MTVVHSGKTNIHFKYSSVLLLYSMGILIITSLSFWDFLSYLFSSDWLSVRVTAAGTTTFKIASVLNKITVTSINLYLAISGILNSKSKIKLFQRVLNAEAFLDIKIQSFETKIVSYSVIIYSALSEIAFIYTFYDQYPRSLMYFQNYQSFLIKCVAVEFFEVTMAIKGCFKLLNSLIPDVFLHNSGSGLQCDILPRIETQSGEIKTVFQCYRPLC